MPKTIKTSRTTKVRAALREAAMEALGKMLARLPPGRATSESEAERLGGEAASAARKRGV